MLVGILTADGLAARVAVTVAVEHGRENGYPPVTRVCAWCENPIPALGIRCLCALDVPYVFMARFSIRAGSPGYTRTDVVYPVVGSPAAGGLASLDRSVTVLADPSRSVAESIWHSAVAAIGEISALNSRSDMRVLWMRHEFSQFSRFCVAPLVWHRRRHRLGSSRGGTTLIIHRLPSGVPCSG